MQNSFYLRFLLVLALFLGVMEGYAQKEAIHWNMQSFTSNHTPSLIKWDLSGNLVPPNQSLPFFTPPTLYNFDFRITPISDRDGNLKFYTSPGMNTVIGGNGAVNQFRHTIFKTNGDPVANSEFIPIQPPSINSERTYIREVNAITIPQPGSCNKYFYFSRYRLYTSGCTSAIPFCEDKYYGNGLRYSIFDTQTQSITSLNNSLYEDYTQGRERPYNSLEPITAALHQDYPTNKGVWIISNEWITDLLAAPSAADYRSVFRTFLLNQTGIISQGLISEIPYNSAGIPTTGTPSADFFGHQTVSPNGKYIAMISRNYVILCDFNQSTGGVSFRQTITLPQSVQSVAFSQKSNMLYIDTRNTADTESTLFRFNILNNSLETVYANYTTPSAFTTYSHWGAERRRLVLTYNDIILWKVATNFTAPIPFIANASSTSIPNINFSGLSIPSYEQYRDIIANDGFMQNFPSYYFSDTYNSPLYSHCLNITTGEVSDRFLNCSATQIRVPFTITGQGTFDILPSDLRVQFSQNSNLFTTTDINGNTVSLGQQEQLLNNINVQFTSQTTSPTGEQTVTGYIDAAIPTPPILFNQWYYFRVVSLNPYVIGSTAQFPFVKQDGLTVNFNAINPNPICGGNTTNISLAANNVSGMYEIKLTNSLGGVFTTTVNFVNGIASFNYPVPTVGSNQNITVAITSITDKNTPLQNYCLKPGASTTVSVLAGTPLTATMSATSPVCRGSNASLTINFTGGAAPWTFTIPALSASPIVSYNNPYVATIPTSSLASNSVVYNMTALSSSSTANCGGVNLPSPVTLVVNEVPTATINCPNPLLSLTVNQSSTLPATFTGTAPFSYQTTVYAHKKNGSVQTSTLPTVANQPANVLLPVSITGVCNTHENNDIDYLEYEVKVTDATGCESIVSNKCRVNVNPIADLWAKDTDDDTGVEDGILTGQEIWHSPDIWVRNSRDFGLDPQNPIANQVNYVYVRIRNRGQVAAAGKLSAFFVRPITSLAWPEHFVSHGYVDCGTIRLGGELSWQSSLQAPRILQGNVINNISYTPLFKTFPTPVPPAPVWDSYGAYDFPAVAPGEEIILEIPWQAPDISPFICSPFKANHYCLFATISQNPSNTCCANGIRFLENPNTCDEYEDAYMHAALNNNVIWRNLYMQGVGGLTGDNTSIIAISNPSSSPIDIRLDFTTPANQQADSYFNYGKAFVDITHNNVYGTWTGGGQNVTNHPTQSLIELTNHTSSIYNLTLAPQQMAYLKVNFQWYNNPANGREFILSMKQSNVGVTPARVMGGQEFRIRADFGNPAPNTCSDNGIVACYRFNGDATDGSGNNNHLSIGQGVSLTTDKQNAANSAYFFSGTGSYMTASSSSTLTSPTRAISLSGWFQAQSSGGQGWVPLISKGSQYKLLGYFNGSYLTALNFSGYYFSAQSAVGIAPILMPDGLGWYHITVTGDRYGINFYVNNQLVSTQEISYDTTTDEDNLMLGYSTGKTSISGKMDDIRIYNRVLTTTEISTIFTRQSSSSLGRVEQLVNTTDDIALYPNPVKDILQVELTNLNAGQVDIIIYDMMGRKIHTQHVDKDENHLRFTINTTEFLSGLYMIEFNQNGNRTVKKFVKN